MKTAKDIGEFGIAPFLNGGVVQRGASAILIAAIAFMIAPLGASGLSITYTDFSSASVGSTLQINGNAAANAAPVGNETAPVLRLTPAADNQAGSAFSKTTIQLGNNASFGTAFAFQMSQGGGISDGTSNPLGADGFVFVLNTVANNVGTLGQGVGYQGVANSVGIKFDTWADSVANGFPQDSDPNGNFVAIYDDGSTQTAGYLPYSSSNPSTANQYYTPSTVMKNGDIWYAWIDYNGVTDELDVRLSDGVDVRPTNAQLSETINLDASSILGSSPAVYAGFTSGTGAAYDDNDILDWQFNDNYSPITQVGSVPDGGPGVFLEALTLLGVCLLAYPFHKRISARVS